FLFHRPERYKRDRFAQFTTDVREPSQRKKGVFYCEKYTKSFELHQGGEAVTNSSGTNLNNRRLPLVRDKDVPQ
ncbi:hypothetical protein WI902_28665, partial [Salmonella enterica subsp. enterica serovar Corvallis]